MTVRSLIVLGALAGTMITAGCGGTPTTTSLAIDPAEYSNTIDNPYMPLKPGTTFVYECTGAGGSSRIEVTVTHEIKTVMGVACMVVNDSESTNGNLVEQTFDWYAQDKAGNVWYFGEDSKVYRNGEVVGTSGSWEAGVNGAEPGIIMEASPKVGDSYRQEYLKGEAEDMAEVVAVDQTLAVPYGTFAGGLTTKEWTPLEPLVLEEKKYAPGVGLVQARTVKGGSEVENLVEIITE